MDLPALFSFDAIGVESPLNLLLLGEEDLAAGNRARVEDDRVRHVRKVLGKTVGDEIRVGIVNGRIGSGRILRLDENSLELEVRLDADPPPSLGIDLVLALPRPKFVGRIVQAIASMGVDRLSFLQTTRVQKSYWQSSVLDRSSIERHLRLGLEQGAATAMPAVELRKNFRGFVDDDLKPRLTERPGLVADASGSLPFPRRVSPPHTVIVGPEGGLVDDEIAAFREAGAVVVSLGRRLLRVEVAVAVCLSRCLPD